MTQETKSEFEVNIKCLKCKALETKLKIAVRDLDRISTGVLPYGDVRELAYECLAKIKGEV